MQVERPSSSVKNSQCLQNLFSSTSIIQIIQHSEVMDSHVSSSLSTTCDKLLHPSSCSPGAFELMCLIIGILVYVHTLKLFLHLMCNQFYTYIH